MNLRNIVRGPLLSLLVAGPAWAATPAAPRHLRFAGTTQITVTGNNGVPSVVTADPNATAETKALFYNLQQMTKNGSSGVLFGQENGTGEGVSFNESDGFKSDARTITGKGPAVIGIDIAGIVGDWWDPTQSDFEDLKDEAKEAARRNIRSQYSRGGMAAMAWHQNNPVSGLGSWDGPMELWRIAPPELCTQMVAAGLSVPNCGSHFTTYRRKLGEYADWVLTVKDDSNVPIPIIYRPFHENSRGWFWWSNQGPDGEPADARYQACIKGIWAWMHDYLTNTKGVHQLLYAISPNGNHEEDPLSRTDYLSYIPDMSLLDILGYDFYTYPGNPIPIAELQMISQLAKDNDKAAAMTEGGYLSPGWDELVYTSQCQPGGSIYNWYSEKQIGHLLDVGGFTYYLTWFTRQGGEHYGPIPGTCTATDFLAEWQAHHILLEGEGEGGVAKDYYSMPTDLPALQVNEASAVEGGSDSRSIVITVTLSDTGSPTGVVAERLTEGSALANQSVPASRQEALPPGPEDE